MKVRALHIGQRIDVRALQAKLKFSLSLREPFIFQYKKNKYVVIFRYGIVVFWNFNPQEENEILLKINEFIFENFPLAYVEEVEINTRKGHDEAKGDSIGLNGISAEKVAVVSIVLSRSLVLDYFEKELGEVLKNLEEVIKIFSNQGRTYFSSRNLLKRVGKAMHIQHVAVNQMAMLDKPDLTWEVSSLDKFYNLLADNYEIDERYEIFTDKVEMLFRSIEFILSYLEAKRSNFLEMIIIFLILIEIALFVYELWL